MNIYLLTQTVNRGWDTYDSAVVTAINAEKAKMIHPYSKEWDGKDKDYSCWCAVENVQVKFIGTSNENESKVICASFNAG